MSNSAHRPRIRNELVPVAVQDSAIWGRLADANMGSLDLLKTNPSRDYQEFDKGHGVNPLPISNTDHATAHLDSPNAPRSGTPVGLAKPSGWYRAFRRML